MDHFTPHEDLLDVKLRDLLFFLLIFEHRKLIDAAKAMKISVPTAERKLKSLRSAFGDSLFTRGGTKGFFMVPTQRAADLYPKIKTIVQTYQAARIEKPFEPLEIRNTFHLAVNSHGLFFIPEAFFQNFCERCPNAKLRIVRPTSDIFEMLRSGEADFGFSYRAAEPEDSGIHSYPIYTGKAIVAVRKGHPLEEVNASRMLSIGDLRPFTYVRLYSKLRKFANVRYLDECLSSEPLNFQGHIDSPFFLSGPLITRCTDAVCICPEIIAEPWRQAGLISCLDADFLQQTFTLHLVWHERTHVLPEFQFMRSLLLSK